MIVLSSLENDITLGRNRTVNGTRHLAGVYWFLLSLTGEMGTEGIKRCEGGEEEIPTTDFLLNTPAELLCAA